MRVHASVACTMLVVGMLLLLSPLAAWAYVAGEKSLVAPEPPMPIAMASMIGALVGLVLVTSAVLLSVTARNPGDQT